MGFNAIRLAKAAFCVVLALAVGFLGALYIGAKLFTPGEEATQREPQRTHSIKVEPTSPREQASAPAQMTSRPGTPAQPLPDSTKHVAEPVKNLPDPEALPKEAQKELRIGQQERRRLRAERRRNLEDANARLRQRRKPVIRESTRDEPFIPFRLQ